MPREDGQTRAVEVVAEEAGRVHRQLIFSQTSSGSRGRGTRGRTIAQPNAARANVKAWVSRRPSRSGRTRNPRPRWPRNRPRLTAQPDERVVHSGGHKIRPGLVGILIFRRFLRIRGIGVESPTISAVRWLLANPLASFCVPREVSSTAVR
jgi:hypothetical protein